MTTPSIAVLPNRVATKRLALALLAAFFLPLAHAEDVQVLDLLRAVQPAANTVAIGTRAGFVLESIAVPAGTALPRAGDQVTALVALGSFAQKTPPRQWLIRLQLAATPNAETEAERKGGQVQYTNTGENFTFHSRRTTMVMETLGPIAAGTPPDRLLTAKRGEIAVGADFLALDLGRGADVIRRIMTGPKENPLTLTTGPKPFPADEIKLQQPRAAAYGLTTEDVRSFAGSLPALMQFLRIVNSTPDLQAILFEVLEKPSILDVLTHPSADSLDFKFLGGGTSAGREIFWPQAPDQKFDVLFVTLNSFGKPMLNVALYVTAPLAPLLNTAGIVGIMAWSPTKPDKFLGVRVLSATAGPAIPNHPDPVATKSPEVTK